MVVLLAGLGALVLGAGVGAGVRIVLGRMRRGAVVSPGWCEAGVAVLWAGPAVGVAAGAVGPAWLPTALGFGVLAVAATVTDVAHRRLPDRLTLPAAVLAPLALLPLGPGAAGTGLVGAAVFLAAHAVVHLAAPGALGAGDVKLAASLGAPLAAVSWGALVAVPVLAAAVLVLGAVVVRPRGPGLPFGPPMIAATGVVLAVGLLTG